MSKITSEITETSVDISYEYPVAMKSKGTPKNKKSIIVLFNNCQRGTVIHSTDPEYNVGDGNIWDDIEQNPDLWEKFVGVIEIVCE